MAIREDLKALDARTGWLVALSCLPAAAAGLLAQDVVERRLGTPGPTAALLAGAGAVLWAADRRPQGKTIGPSDVLVASLAQVVALAPGVSRSGATLTALRALGVGRSEATRFSLLMSLPVTAGAAAATITKSRQLPSLTPFALSALAAYLTTTLSTTLTRSLTAKSTDRAAGRLLSGSALYRAGLAAVVAARLGRERRARELR